MGAANPPSPQRTGPGTHEVGGGQGGEGSLAPEKFNTFNTFNTFTTFYNLP